MTARLRELAERWGMQSGSMASAAYEACAAELLSILDADGDGGEVACGYLITWNDQSYRGKQSLSFDRCGPDDGTFVPVFTHPRPARSGGVSDADVDGALAAHDRAWDDYKGNDRKTRRYAMRAALTHFAKGNTMNKQSIAVPDYVSADDANRLYGENFGIDWVYEGRDIDPSTELFAGTTDQLNALSIRLPDEDRQWCDTHGMEHSVELADGDCEFPSKGERHE